MCTNDDECVGYIINLNLVDVQHGLNVIIQSNVLNLVLSSVKGCSRRVISLCNWLIISTVWCYAVGLSSHAG